LTHEDVELKVAIFLKEIDERSVEELLDHRFNNTEPTPADVYNKFKTFQI
jgi:hypothetical protein